MERSNPTAGHYTRLWRGVRDWNERASGTLLTSVAPASVTERQRNTARNTRLWPFFLSFFLSLNAVCFTHRLFPTVASTPVPHVLRVAVRGRVVSSLLGTTPRCPVFSTTPCCPLVPPRAVLWYHPMLSFGTTPCCPLVPPRAVLWYHPVLSFGTTPCCPLVPPRAVVSRQFPLSACSSVLCQGSIGLELSGVPAF